MFTVRPCTWRLNICVGNLAAINCNALRHDRRKLMRTASLLSYNSSFVFNFFVQPILVLTGIDIDIFVNCNWVDSRWQQHSTRLHTNNTQKTQLTNWEECGPCSVFASCTLAFALQLRKKHRKTLVRVAEECQLARWRQNIQNRTYITIRIHKHKNKNI